MSDKEYDKLLKKSNKTSVLQIDIVHKDPPTIDMTEIDKEYENVIDLESKGMKIPRVQENIGAGRSRKTGAVRLPEVSRMPNDTKPSDKSLPMNSKSRNQKQETNHIDWTKLENETAKNYNPLAPKAHEYIATKYDLGNDEDLLIKLQEDILVKLKVLMDQAYCINDIRAYSSASSQAIALIAQIREMKGKSMTKEENQDFIESVRQFNDRLSKVK